MALLPDRIERDVFTVSLDGSYGRFKTTESFELSYLLTSLKIGELDRLETAAQAIPFQSISFNELIQRDIDYDRVDNELVDKYLAKGKNRVVFFPPILVSVIAFDEDDQRVELYKTVTIKPENNRLVTTFDHDKFQLVLNLWESATGYSVKHDGKSYNYLPYAATIRFNPQSVKLVVIDGQHRLVALQRIRDNPETRHLIQDAEVPICVFFTPDAVQKPGQVESISGDLRELFVTINSKAKTVSGHFIVLLDDKHLSSYAIRALAGSWKQAGTSHLAMLEWNTREARKASQVQKPYCITTVSIIASCLADYVFAQPADVQTLLNLKEVAEKLKIQTNSPTYSQIDEETFGLEQVPVLNDQLNKYITPSLDILLLKPRPYREMVERFEEAVEQLERQIAANTPGAKSFRDDVLFQFRQTADNDLEALKVVEHEFESIAKRPDDEDSVYFLNVFQQGVIRAWLEFCRLAVPELEINPQACADALVSAWEAILFKSRKKLFDQNHAYIQGFLYEGQRLRINENTRTQWKNLVLGSLLHKAAMENLLNKLQEFGLPKDKLEEFSRKIGEEAKKAIGEYLKALKARLSDDMEQNYRFRGLSQADIIFLVEREQSENEALRKEFDTRIESITHDRVEEARKTLSNVLGVRASHLPAI